MNKIEKNTQKTRGFKASTAKIRLGVMILFSLFLVGFASAAFNSSLDDNLVSYWKLDETSGTVIDVLGINNGTNSGATPNVAGKINTAYDFDSASNDYISVSDDDSLNPSIALSISGWFYIPESASAQQGLIAKYIDGSTRDWGFFLLTNDVIWSVVSVGNSHKQLYSTETVNFAEWNHIVMTYDGSNQYLYINNVSISRAQIGSMDNSNADVFFGNRRGTDRPFDGKIDEVGLWNRSLTPSEISDLYNSGDGLSYPFVIPAALPQINLTSPKNNSIIIKSDYNFTTNLSITGVATDWEWKNITYSVWDSDGDLFNETLKSGLSGNETNETQLIGGLTLGQYYWNSYACYSNATFGNCSWGDDGNYTFYLGASLNSLTYSNNTYETATENFFANFSVLESAEISLAQLVYNGTNYTITNLTQTGTSLLLQRSMDIPLNINGSANETKDFFFRFLYGGEG